MVFKNLCVILLWTKVASAVEGLIRTDSAGSYWSEVSGVTYNSVIGAQDTRPQNCQLSYTH